MRTAKLDAVIIGAGAAGIAAGRALAAKQLNVLLLEARERIGGRAFTVDDGHGDHVELGAEFIHGRAEALAPLLTEGRQQAMDIDGERCVLERGRLRPMNDFWERLDGVMGRLHVRRDRDFSFADFITRHPGGARLDRERQLALQWVEGFHAAEPRLVSAYTLANGGWPGDDAQERRLGRLVKGYRTLLDWLAAPLAGRIALGAVVRRIEWSRNRATVYAQHGDDSAPFTVEARAVVVTVPIGVLKAPAGDAGAIEFVPEVPQKRAALSKIASGSVVRVVLRLREPLWQAGHEALSFVHSVDGDFPTWWTAYPLREPRITAWRGGPGARRLARLTRPELEATAVAALARHFAVPVRRARGVVEAVWTHDWEHDPFARGAYSYRMVGGADAAAALARPVAQTLFFAGEATSPEQSGTVDGALESGRRAAKQVMRALT